MESCRIFKFLKSSDLLVMFSTLFSMGILANRVEGLAFGGTMGSFVVLIVARVNFMFILVKLLPDE